MILSERAEEILETLWIEIIEKKNNKCDASILRDDVVIKDLIKSGYIEIKKNHITLTPKGKKEARDCIRRHRLAERLLVDILDYKENLIHETSCKFEHLLHKGLDDNICTLLGHPKTCPHGKPIPEGNCCLDNKKRARKIIMPLTELEINKKAVISYIQTQERIVLQKLIAMGALPNTKITLMQKFPSYVFKIGKSQFAIDEELAGAIHVRTVKS